MTAERDYRGGSGGRSRQYGVTDALIRFGPDAACDRHRDAPADDFLTNQTEIVVSGSFTDATSVSVLVGSVIASVTGDTFTASVPLVEGPNTLTVSAADAAGNTATVSLAGRRDTVLPSIVLSAPETARRNEEVTLSAVATDDFGIGVVRFFVDGVLASEDSTSFFEHTFVVPPTAASGSLINVRAEAEDLARNVAEATALNIRVVAGGFISGEVYDASRGLPLPGATVSHAGGASLRMHGVASVSSRSRRRSS